MIYPYDHRRIEIMLYIACQEALKNFCEHAHAYHMVALDTEFIRERTYYPNLCLIQAATAQETAQETAVIDPLASLDLAPVAELLADESTTKVFHGCSQDLEVLYTSLGVIPSPVFDTQIAAAFLGMRLQIGYGALVKEFCGVSLPKAEALSDWARRPLEPEQLDYAADDVRYLPVIYKQMEAQLIKKKRLSWVLPEMRSLVEHSVVCREPAEAYLHLKRAQSLTRRQLAIAREACAWRERTAASHNVPRRWVLSDEVIVECCRHIPADVAHLKRIRGTESLSATDAPAFLSALRRGQSSSPADYPRSHRRERPSPETEGVIDLMSALVRIVSQQSGIATQLLASREDLLNYLGHKSCPLDTGWRHDLIATHLDKLLCGECGLTVKDGHIELL